jgi:outer membrane protein TolC
MRCRLLIACGVLAGSLVSAGEPEAARASFLRAIAEAPALGAAYRRTDAARERTASAGRLADPEVEGMGSRKVGPMNERSTMWEVNVRQPLTKPGERTADRERARALVAMAEADYAVMAGEIAADTAMALAEADGARQRIRYLEAQVGRLDSVFRSLEARLAAGSTGRMADRLTVQTRIAALQLTIEEEQAMAADALAAARGRLGLRPDAPLPEFAAPTVAEIKIDEAAALRLAAARSDEARAMIKVARASASPMTAVGVRFENERTAMGDENTLGLAFSSEIPWRGRRYARAEVRAAEADRAAAETDGTAARYRISAALTRVQRAERLAETARRLSGETRARLDAEYDSLVRSAGVASSGADSSILQLVELLEKSADTELRIVRADTAVQTARAELWRYLPAGDFSTPLQSATP